MNIESELKPCPFCGGEAEIIDDAMGTISRCQRCGAENGNGVYGDRGHKLAVKDWNSRPIEEDLEEENARLRRELSDEIDQNQKNIYEMSVQSARGANYALKEIKKIEDENKKLREALTFYAKGEHLGLEDWQTEQILKDDEVFAESYCETGKVAREALKAGKNAE